MRWKAARPLRTRQLDKVSTEPPPVGGIGRRINLGHQAHPIRGQDQDESPSHRGVAARWVG